MRTTKLFIVGLAVIAGSTVGGCAEFADEPAPIEQAAVNDDVVEGDIIEPEMVLFEPDSILIREVIRTPSSVGEVVFPHYMHVDDMGMECAECHHEVNATSLEIPRDHGTYFEDFWIDCTTCHGNSDKLTGEAMSCSTCHHDKPGAISDQTLSSKVVIHKSCWSCHDMGRGADASSECGSCHSGPKRSLVAPIQ